MKKLVSLILAVCLMLTAVAFASAEAVTASATAEGFEGDVTVTVTVEDGKITDVVMEGAQETPDKGGVAMEALTAAILEQQTPLVDVYAGATITSKAAIAAATEALAQAGLNFEAAKGEDETLDCDVLVIGMGASGTVAALSAAENGAKVIGVESSQSLGGFGNAAQGMFAIGSSLQYERYGDDLGSTEQDWFEHIFDRTQYLGNGKLIRMLVAESKNTVEYVLDHDIAMYLSDLPQQIAHFGETVVYHRWNNTQPFEHFAEYLDKNNVDIHYGTTATELLTDESGAVVGAVAVKDDGGVLTINAKSVIVSTGSFAGNEAMMREALGDDVYEVVTTIGGCDGSGLEMMYAVGAAKGELLTMNHGVGPKSSDVQQVNELTLNTPCLWVNRQGKRFMSESLLKDTVEFSSAVLAQGGYAYTIVDQATMDRWCDQTQENTGSWVHYWDRFGIVDENGNPTIYHAPLDKDVVASDFEVLTATGDGIIAETLDEVAAYIGCDPDTLKETVANYNSYVEAGQDDEFFKDPEDLLWTVEEGPYYVTKGYNAVLGALGGVNVTEKLEVLDTVDQPIANLYSTGNNLSGISVAAYGNVEGVGLSTALTTGRMAGVYAAENAAK